MTTSLREELLRFDFDDSWKVIGRWDGTSASRYKIFQDTPACVDLVGIDGTGAVYLIEVKDYSKNVREKEKPLHEVLRDKVHDTVMGLITAHRRGDTTMLSEPLARALVKGAPVYVVLHIEEPTHQVVATSRQRLAVDGSVLMRQYANDFRWLNARLLVVNRHNCQRFLPGLSVHRLPPAVE